MPTDADTTRNADELWEIVYLVQETISKEGRFLAENGRVADIDAVPPIAALRKIRGLADECNPESRRP